MYGSLKLTEFLFLVEFHFGACHWHILVPLHSGQQCSQQESSWFKPQPGHSTPNTITSGFKKLM